MEERVSDTSVLSASGAGGLHRLGALVRGVVDYALPPSCAGCGAIVAEDRQFCLSCWQSLHFLDGPACAGCSFPLPDYIFGGELYCAGCLQTRSYFKGAPAAIAYSPIARRIVLRLKYSRRLGLARLMSDMMSRPLQRLQGSLPMLLVPVPLHRWRLWGRGFNQSALIAQHLVRESSDEHPIAMSNHVLKRVRATPSMRGLNIEQRHEAVRGAFALCADVKATIAEHHVVLVDDVYTSGATLRACARLLDQAGAMRLSAVTFARVVPDIIDSEVLENSLATQIDERYLAF